MLSLSPGSHRNTKCYQIGIGGDTFYVSYQTIIGARVWGEPPARLHNSWGPTTGRHINDMGIRDFREVEEAELQSLIRKSLIRIGGELMLQPFKESTK